MPTGMELAAEAEVVRIVGAAPPFVRTNAVQSLTGRRRPPSMRYTTGESAERMKRRPSAGVMTGVSSPQATSEIGVDSMPVAAGTDRAYRRPPALKESGHPQVHTWLTALGPSPGLASGVLELERVLTGLERLPVGVAAGGAVPVRVRVPRRVRRPGPRSDPGGSRSRRRPPFWRSIPSARHTLRP